MLGPRTRSAAQRAPRADPVDGDCTDDDDGRQSKRTNHGILTHAAGPASKLYAKLIVSHHLLLQPTRQIHAHFQIVCTARHVSLSRSIAVF